MDNHTPGPWKVIANFEDSVTRQEGVKGADAIVTAMDTGRIVVHPTLGICGQRISEAGANARLISLAPELFQALGELTAEAENESGLADFNNRRGSFGLQMARNVLAKMKERI